MLSCNRATSCSYRGSQREGVPTLEITVSWCSRKMIQCSKREEALKNRYKLREMAIIKEPIRKALWEQTLNFEIDNYAFGYLTI